MVVAVFEMPYKVECTECYDAIDRGVLLYVAGACYHPGCYSGPLYMSDIENWAALDAEQREQIMFYMDGNKDDILVNAYFRELLEATAAGSRGRPWTATC